MRYVVTATITLDAPHEDAAVDDLIKHILANPNKMDIFIDYVEEDDIQDEEPA